MFLTFLRCWCINGNSATLYSATVPSKINPFGTCCMDENLHMVGFLYLRVFLILNFNLVSGKSGISKSDPSPVHNLNHLKS